jgi:chemotaxis family two-component system response regulator Rcp1
MNRTMTRRMMEILLVEDSMTDAREIISMLRGTRLKHRLTLIRDGVEAMEFLRREGKFVRAPRPDLILLDLYLPKKDGWQVLSEMRSEYDLHDIPVVIVSDSAVEQYVLAGEGLDVECFLSKPVDRDELLSTVMQVAPVGGDQSLLLQPS